MTAPSPVVLSADPADRPAAGEQLAASVERLVGRPVEDVLAWAVGAGHDVPLPGAGATRERWELLATVAAVDLVVARVLEPHLDALAVLAEAGADPGPRDGSWGVWAAEAPDARLEAVPDPGGGWRLTGRKAWCSLAGQVSHALVTAWVGDDERAMFAIDLRDDRIAVEEGSWSAHALAAVSTSGVRVADAPATAVGGTGWYLERPGFAWGGAGVAAVWYGGAVGLARRLHGACTRREPDQVALMHLGAVDAALAAARAGLAVAADQIDAGDAAGPRGALLAARVRQVVADACEEVSGRVAHALGPGPLAHEHRHARRVADLALYLRQHHAERDQAALGRDLLASAPAGVGPW